MRKLLLLLCAVLVLCTACAGKAERFSSPDEVLLKINGSPVLTARDYLFAEAWQNAEKELFHKAALTEDALFSELSAAAACSVFAEEYGTAADKPELEGEYEVYIESAGSDEESKQCAQKVKAALSLSDSELKELYLKNAYFYASTDALVKDIAGVYTDTSDPESIRERVMDNIREIASYYDIEANFAGTERELDYAAVTN